MLTDQIARTRRFYRAVTAESGALDSSYLGLGRPLGPARVLNAIGQGMEELDQIRNYLRIDSAQLSRYLRGLEDEGLVTTRISGSDSRCRIATLTDAGAEEIRSYERLSDEQASTVLARHPRPKALLDAMDLVAIAFGLDRTRYEIVSPSDPRAQACLNAFYTELSQRFERGFDVAKSCDPDHADMTPPRGAFLLMMLDRLPIGCAGLKGTDHGYAEIKRMWITPAARGMGLTHRLMAEIEDKARALGINTLRLDTNSILTEACAYYRKHGWTEIERFNPDPYPDLFFEKKL
ncbi:MarR family transcriptional regulator [Paracoccus aurantiacus]|uniref:MarR family transcriptional regulator n=1 Tax=Paracoccus aurantiacus TaxID=2599412 RepID=A0A5C6S9X5_9RHOB|nr:helix-turn-helix domain-containing GNAT family N-acetyltransferase [Paracoccus aurantiacus]TXB70385.1 MarR family transcriptional regulator [Paracoccus aurantiacus]